MNEHKLEQPTVRGEVVAIDYDLDSITVRLENGEEKVLPFEPFDAGDVFQVGQRFSLTSDDSGEPMAAVPLADAESATLLGYVESVDVEDELVWVYVRDEEGWHRKVMPLDLFAAQGLAQPGKHFRIETDDSGTPVRLNADEQDLAMQLEPAEATKPRWTSRPAAEAE